MKCSYCTSEVEKGTGLVFVKKNGSVRYYCTKRCYRLNAVHDRRPNKKEVLERSSA